MWVKHFAGLSFNSLYNCFISWQRSSFHLRLTELHVALGSFVWCIRMSYCCHQRPWIERLVGLFMMPSVEAVLNQLLIYTTNCGTNTSNERFATWFREKFTKKITTVTVHGALVSVLLRQIFCRGTIDYAVNTARQVATPGTPPSTHSCTWELLIWFHLNSSFESWQLWANA